MAELKITKRSNDSEAISKHLQEQKRSWVLAQITALAETFATPITPERLAVYATDLGNYGKGALGIALTRARRECKFFPQLAEIIERIPPNSEMDKQSEIDRINELKRRAAAGEEFYSQDDFFAMMRTTLERFQAEKAMVAASTADGDTKSSESSD